MCGFTVYEFNDLTRVCSITCVGTSSVGPVCHIIYTNIKAERVKRLYNSQVDKIEMFMWAYCI